MHLTPQQRRKCRRRLMRFGELNARLYALAPDHPHRPELERTLAELDALPCLHSCEDSRGALACTIADDQPILPTLRGEEPAPDRRIVIIND